MQKITPFLWFNDNAEEAINTYAPFVLSPFINVPVHQYNPQADLDDTGLGLYGTGTVTAGRFDVTAGARFDHENRSATVGTLFVEPFFQQLPATSANESFSNVSPQFSLGYRARPDTMAYVSVTNGFKAGGFNPASPAGSPRKSFNASSRSRSRSWTRTTRPAPPWPSSRIDE